MSTEHRSASSGSTQPLSTGPHNTAQRAGGEAAYRSTVWFGEPVEHEAGAEQPGDVQDKPIQTLPRTPETQPARSSSATVTGVGKRRPAGPNPTAILLGLLCLAVAAMTIAREVSGVIVHLALVGPVVIVVAGLVFLLAGLSGLLRRR